MDETQMQRLSQNQSQKRKQDQNQNGNTSVVGDARRTICVPPSSEAAARVLQVSPLLPLYLDSVFDPKASTFTSLTLTRQAPQSPSSRS